MQQHLLSAKGSIRIKGLSLVILVLAAAWGCAGPMPQRPGPAAMAAQGLPSHRPMVEPAKPTDGSLWSENGELVEMFTNPKARRIGDILTVKIVESSKATNKASTTTDRSSGMSAKVDGFFNLEKDFPASRSFFNPFSGVNGNISSDFEGTGETERSGALNAFMTAMIVDVMPNGNMVIEGNREVRVNAENQLITLTGLVRPRDISADNVILSTYIADARISYSGTGVLNDRQKPGWLTRALDKVWPF